MAPAAFTAAWPVHRFGEIDSTNEEARRRAIAGDTGPCWLTAAAQTAGKGRLGRQWSSPTGNLFATALFVFPGAPAQAALASYSAGLAVLDAIRIATTPATYVATPLSLKWPNDVLAGEAKLCGILIETGTMHGQLWMAAGFGINVAHAPQLPDRPTACIAELPGGEGVTADGVLSALDIHFRARIASLLNEGFGPTHDAWLARAAHLDQRVSANTTAGRVEGVMKGLGDDGALIIELDSGSQTHVRAGEISLLG